MENRRQNSNDDSDENQDCTVTISMKHDPIMTKIEKQQNPIITERAV